MSLATSTVVGVHFGFPGGLAESQGTTLVIASISASSGVAGDVITFTGSGFTGCSSVQFGDMPSLAVVVLSDTSMTAVVPALLPCVTRAVGPSGAGTGPAFTYAGATVSNPNFVVTAVKTGNYTAAFNQIVRADAVGGAFAVTLPAATTATATANMVVVKNLTTGANAVTLTPAGADTIDGVAGSFILAARESLFLVADTLSDWLAI